jgi:hypothetical protein
LSEKVTLFASGDPISYRTADIRKSWRKLKYQ